MESLRKLEYAGYDSARLALDLPSRRALDAEKPPNLAKSVMDE